MKISNTLLTTKKIKTLTVCAKILALCQYIMYFVNIRTSHLARFLKHSKALTVELGEMVKAKLTSGFKTLPVY